MENLRNTSQYVKRKTIRLNEKEKENRKSINDSLGREKKAHVTVINYQERTNTLRSERLILVRQSSVQLTASQAATQSHMICAPVRSCSWQAALSLAAHFRNKFGFIARLCLTFSLSSLLPFSSTLSSPFKRGRWKDEVVWICQGEGRGVCGENDAERGSTRQEEEMEIK